MAADLFSASDSIWLIIFSVPIIQATSKISDSVEHEEACEQAEDRVELYSDTEDHTLGSVVFFLGKNVD